MDYLEDVLSVQNSISQLNNKNSIMEKQKFLKPFELGWKREVVMRVVTDSRRPNCDIYYFHPNGRKFRSMAEIKTNLTDGLDPECFTFKKQPLNVASEVVRQARVRGKKSSLAVKPRKQTTENDRQNQKVPKIKTVSKSTRGCDTKLVNDEEKPRPVLRLKSRRQSMIQKKQQLKAVLNLKKGNQTKVVLSKKKSKKAIGNRRAQALEEDEGKAKNFRAFKNNKVVKKSKSRTNEKKSQTRKKETSREKVGRVAPTPEISKEKEINNELSKDVEDIKSIVQKNIVKYREMRKKEMLEKFERNDKPGKKVKSEAEAGKSASRHRSGNIAENFEIFLQPLEKGWRRELVFRNGAYPKGQSDVYYYHPNGRKFRSAREVSEHMTPGLSISNFTFRKEPLGCGEPKEIIRNARPHQKNLVSVFPLRMVKK